MADGNIETLSWAFSTNSLLCYNPPTFITYYMYGTVIFIFIVFGVFANLMNFIVFMQPRMKLSVFSYLAALSLLDTISCILLLLTALSRSYFWTNIYFRIFDLIWQYPLLSMATGAANLLLALVCVDRWIFLHYSTYTTNYVSRFCCPCMARRLIIIVTCLSIVVNLPYCFIITKNRDNIYITSKLFNSTFYLYINWFIFILLFLVPAIMLIVGNIAILSAFHRWRTIGNKLYKTTTNVEPEFVRKRRVHQTKLTITIITVITLYVLGELPEYLTSKKSIVNLTNDNSWGTSKFLEIYSFTSKSIQLSLNLLIYAYINPIYKTELQHCIRKIRYVICFIWCLKSCRSSRIDEEINKIDENTDAWGDIDNCQNNKAYKNKQQNTINKRW